LTSITVGRGRFIAEPRTAFPQLLSRPMQQNQTHQALGSLLRGTNAGSSAWQPPTPLRSVCEGQCGPFGPDIRTIGIGLEPRRSLPTEAPPIAKFDVRYLDDSVDDTVARDGPYSMKRDNCSDSWAWRRIFTDRAHGYGTAMRRGDKRRRNSCMPPGPASLRNLISRIHVGSAPGRR
jgi:hypothetical protein